jgi:hypothetical protein
MRPGARQGSREKRKPPTARSKKHERKIKDFGKKKRGIFSDLDLD